MRRRSTHRAFTIVPVVLFLGITMVVLGILLMLKAPPATAPSTAYNSGRQVGPMVGSALFAIFAAFVAGKVADRKGIGFSSEVFGAILGLANFAMLVNVLGLAKAAPPAPQPTQPAPVIQPAAPAPRTAPSPPVESPPPLAPAPAVSTPPPAQAAPARNSPKPAPPPPADPIPAPAPSAPPPDPAPDQPAAPAAPAPIDPQQAARDKARPLLDDYSAELSAQIDTAIKNTEAFVKVVAAPPVHDKVKLKRRAADTATLRESLFQLERTLRDSSTTMANRLEQAGTPKTVAFGLGIEFSNTFRPSGRAFACGRLIDLCDRVKEENDLLDANFNWWKFTKGEIDVKDADMRRKLRGPRFFIESSIGHVPRVFDQLHGG